MQVLNFSSKIVENAVKALSSFPGVGQRSALRMVMFLLKRPKEEVEQMAFALQQLKTELRICKECFNVSDAEVCDICKSHNRNKQILCVVEDMQDVMAIENTAQFNGLYHVLGGIISPVEGIGPDVLRISELMKRIETGSFKEIVIALNATIDGDTTTFYLARKFSQYPELMVTTISKGISVGSELEYTDEITLGRSFLSRVPFNL